MKILLIAAIYLVNIFIIPLLLMGIIRKIKALMQNRIGSPILQPFYDFSKLLRKTETISGVASWIFIWTPRVGLSVVILASVLVPWTSSLLPLSFASASNFLLILYLLSVSRFLTMLAAIDTGSAFGGLGASREATISMLVEPTMVFGFVALALGAGSTDLLTIYSKQISPFIALLVGAALVVAALAELSRLPVDDPTTHLELTMVHEAMILEYSGRSLALIEYANAMRACIFLGIASQTLLHIWSSYYTLPMLFRYVVGVFGLMMMGAAVAIAEGVLVKLKWRSVPNFLAFAAVMSLLAVLIAVVQR